ncbi:uncharacterized protein BX664DRAFT_325712 [Halteromyces radiatus]|uniref:uncharacterized protein n=1 Tax=Halteromyces radiatus TaxID=101107 RepID=UPI0022211F9A|nr:uncharacterized protein BX664DRAFT_325712 [Halteromyces radiatus]KAI8097172.1 hypothetical protein BX664DRAFT_325712 [Halteromyces radiatus]
MVQNVGKFLAYASGIIATGYGLMVFTVPNEAEMRKRLDPTLLKEADRMKEHNMERHQQLLDQIRQTAASDKPVWGDINEKKHH